MSYLQLDHNSQCLIMKFTFSSKCNQTTLSVKIFRTKIFQSRFKASRDLVTQRLVVKVIRIFENQAGDRRRRRVADVKNIRFYPANYVGGRFSYARRLVQALVGQAVNYEAPYTN